MRIIIPTTDVPATDEVIDAIADIEMQRQGMEKEAGLAASCSSAPRKLRELLDREKGALQLHGAGTGPPANVDAVPENDSVRFHFTRGSPDAD